MKEFASLRKALDGVMARDYGRLLGRWRKLSAGTPAPEAVAALAQ